MTTPAGDGKTPHRARNLFDGIDLASNTMKVCLGLKCDVRRVCLPRPQLEVKRTNFDEKRTFRASFQRNFKLRPGRAEEAVCFRRRAQ